MAEAQAELQRARAVRTDLHAPLAAALAAGGVPPDVARAIERAIALEEAARMPPGMSLGGRFEARFSLSRIRAQVDAMLRHEERLERTKEKRARDWLAALISDLARLDRYERRALSRRRTAVRHLDELRAAEAAGHLRSAAADRG